MPPSPLALHHCAVAARLSAAGCVFAHDEASLLIDAAHTPAELDAMIERRVAGSTARARRRMGSVLWSARRRGARRLRAPPQDRAARRTGGPSDPSRIDRRRPVLRIGRSRHGAARRLGLDRVVCVRHRSCSRALRAREHRRARTRAARRSGRRIAGDACADASTCSSPTRRTSRPERSRCCRGRPASTNHWPRSTVERTGWTSIGALRPAPGNGCPPVAICSSRPARSRRNEPRRSSVANGLRRTRRLLRGVGDGGGHRGPVALAILRVVTATPQCAAATRADRQDSPTKRG